MDIGVYNPQEAWMTIEERQLVRRFVREMKKLLKEQDTAPAPLLALRINDVVNSYILVRRAERTALMPLPEEEDFAPARRSFDEIGKALDRLRKAMQDLDAALPAPTTTPQSADLATFLQPIFAQAQELLHPDP